MSKSFSTILVPVDFTVNTEIAISRAMEICNRSRCNLHLYYVQPIVLPNVFRYVQYFVSGYTYRQVNESIKQSTDRLEKIKTSIDSKGMDINVFTWVSFGKQVEKAICQKAARLAADLIIIGKISHHSKFPFLNTVVPSRLAATSGIPVLTAKPGSFNKEIKTVVIPVGARFPSSKLQILEALRKEARLQIRLVVFLDDETDPVSAKQSLLHTFQFLKSQSGIPVSYEVLNGRNKPKALLTYCNQVGADVLIVHPESETRVGSWINSHITDLLPTNSKTLVLNVKPIQ